MSTVASNLLGFMVKTDDGSFEGGGGIEYSFREQLAGTEGSEAYDQSPFGRIPLSNQVVNPAVDGAAVQLTISSDFQWMTEQILSKQCRAVHCNWGTAVVLKVDDGDVLAMANYPSFYSNHQGSAKLEDLGNRAVGATYEPGSVQKLLTLASLLDAGLITPETDVPIESRSGGGPPGRGCLHPRRHHAHCPGDRPFVQHRCHHLRRMMEPGRMLEYMRLGLGAARTGLPVSGESARENMPSYQRDSMSFGYGVAVSPLLSARRHQPTVASTTRRRL